jgi:hypothetical protein
MGQIDTRFQVKKHTVRWQEIKIRQLGNGLDTKLEVGGH